MVEQFSSKLCESLGSELSIYLEKNVTFEQNMIYGTVVSKVVSKVVAIF